MKTDYRMTLFIILFITSTFLLFYAFTQFGSLLSEEIISPDPPFLYCITNDDCPEGYTCVKQPGEAFGICMEVSKVVVNDSLVVWGDECMTDRDCWDLYDSCEPFCHNGYCMFMQWIPEPPPGQEVPS